MTQVKTKVAQGGRIVIPAEYRKALGLKPGDTVVLVLQDGEVRLLTMKRAVERIQELIRRYVPEGRSLVQELIEERRQESARE